MRRICGLYHHGACLSRKRQCWMRARNELVTFTGLWNLWFTRHARRLRKRQCARALRHRPLRTLPNHMRGLIIFCSKLRKIEKIIVNCLIRGYLHQVTLLLIGSRYRSWTYNCNKTTRVSYGYLWIWSNTLA